MPIEATNGFSAVVPPAVDAARRAAAHLRPAAPRSASPRSRRSGRRYRTGRCPSGSRRRRHRLRGDGDVGAALDVRFDQLAEVHPIEMVAGEDQVVVGVVAGEVPRRLPHRVGGALKPVGAFRGLFGGEHFDEARRRRLEAIGLRDVPVERRRVELRQHEDPLQARVQAVADRDVDQPILAADRHRRLRAHVGQREEARAAPTSQDQGEHIVHREILSCVAWGI